MKFHQALLENGLEVIAEENDAAYSVSFGFFVKTGSRNETADISGVSHFLEHMVFKGTETRTAADVNRQLDEMGADANAFTTEEQTVFFASLLPELLDEAVDLFGDILRPILRNDDFETEKQVILEEIGMYEDQPPFGADDKSRELFFGDHPLGNSVLGGIESVSNLTADQMRRYFDRRYGPDNTIFVAAGRLDFDHLLASVEQACGHWDRTDPPGSRSVCNGQGERIRGLRGFHRLFKESASLQHTILLFDSPGALDADRFASGLLANIIGDDVGSRLYWELIDSGLADGAEMGVCEFLDNGFYSLGLSCEPEYAEEILGRTRNILRDVAGRGFTSEELERSRNKVLSRLVLANERPGGRLFSFGGEWSVRGEYRTVRQDMDDIRSVTLGDIHAVMGRYPLDDPLLVSIGPRERFDPEAVWHG